MGTHAGALISLTQVTLPCVPEPSASHMTPQTHKYAHSHMAGGNNEY